MALQCLAFIECRDAQQRTHTIEYYVPAPASMGAGVNLPTQAHQLAVINALINAATPPAICDFVVYGYGLKIIQNDVAGITQGNGSVPIRVRIKTRSANGLYGKPNKFGVPEGVLLDFPSPLQDNYTFNPNDRNIVDMSSTLFDAIKAALVAIGYQDNSGNIITSDVVLQSAILTGGKLGLIMPK